MSKSSIHFRGALPTSEAHNRREVALDYTLAGIGDEANEHWEEMTLAQATARAEQECLSLTGRALQKNAEPIREAVVNLNAEHTVSDLKWLGGALEVRYGIQMFQAHVHRDEGQNALNRNYHAHLLFYWRNRKTGKTIKLNRAQLSEIQTFTAEHLGLERGQLRVNSNRERLEATAYKAQQETLKLAKLQEQAVKLEESIAEKKKQLPSLEHELKQWQMSAQSLRADLPISSNSLTRWTNRNLNSTAWMKSVEQLQNLSANVSHCLENGRKLIANIGKLKTNMTVLRPKLEKLKTSFEKFQALKFNLQKCNEKLQSLKMMQEQKNDLKKNQSRGMRM